MFLISTESRSKRLVEGRRWPRTPRHEQPDVPEAANHAHQTRGSSRSATARRRSPASRGTSRESATCARCPPGVARRHAATPCSAARPARKFAKRPRRHERATRDLKRRTRQWDAVHETPNNGVIPARPALRWPVVASGLCAREAIRGTVFLNCLADEAAAASVLEAAHPKGKPVHELVHRVHHPGEIARRNRHTLRPP
jgi:hypothetical protein